MLSIHWSPISMKGILPLFATNAARLVYKIHNIPNCLMIGIDTQLRLPGENVIEICITGILRPPSSPIL